MGVLSKQAEEWVLLTTARESENSEVTYSVPLRG